MFFISNRTYVRGANMCYPCNDGRLLLQEARIMGESYVSSGYETDVTSDQWEVIQTFFPGQSGPGRPRTLNLCAILNALLYLVRTGCQWRLLPKTFPKWSSVR